MTRELTDAAKVAKAIKQELKAIGIKASVKSQNYSGGDSVNVYVNDLNPEMNKKVSDICKKYEMGHFDGMTDCYEYSNINNNLVAQAKYIFIENTPTDETIEKILTWLDNKDRHKQFDTDEKTKEFFSDCCMSRKNIARRLFRGWDFLGGYWNAV